MIESPDRYPFFYEAHLHTSEGSACSVSSGTEMTAAYIQAGYAGIIITDHFFNGNSAVPLDLPWAERVEQFCGGYENACAAAAGKDFAVFFGWEYNHSGTEFLTYGLDKAFLLAHPDLHTWDIVEYLREVRRAGGMVSQAHPFRQRPYIKEIRLFPEYVDAFEVFNAGDCQEWNDLAAAFAAEHSLRRTAGSDTHRAPFPPEAPRAGMGFPERLKSIHDFIAAVKGGDVFIYKNNI